MPRFFSNQSAQRLYRTVHFKEVNAMGHTLVASIANNNIMDFYQALLPVKKQATTRLLEAQHNLYYALFKAAELNRNKMLVHLVKDCTLETRVVNEGNQTLSCVASHLKTKLLINILQDRAIKIELQEFAYEQKNAAEFSCS